MTIQWGMDLGMVGRVGSKAIAVDNSQPSVTPGQVLTPTFYSSHIGHDYTDYTCRPSIWMMMVAFLLNLITFIVRMVWLKQMPRPVWSIKGYACFHDFHPSPPRNLKALHSAASYRERGIVTDSLLSVPVETFIMPCHLQCQRPSHHQTINLQHGKSQFHQPTVLQPNPRSDPGLYPSTRLY